MSDGRIAVVGAGIAGLGSAWLLAQRYDVTLFEREPRLGGHSNTVMCPVAEGEIPVDTGFVVYNEPNYPLLTALFRHLRVPTQASDMSFAFSAGDIDLEYAVDGVSRLFAQRRNLLRPRFLAMAADILRFNRSAAADLDHGLPDELKLADYLDRIGVGEGFRRYYLLPMSAAIWSAPQEEILGFPAQRLLRFFSNHGLIRRANRPQWRTVTGGAREYVRRLREAIASVWVGTPVRRIVRRASTVALFGANGELGEFDQVVIATHADEALASVHEPTFWERRLLAAMRYQRNTAWLHRDRTLMPRRRAVWSSWNHLSGSWRDGSQPVGVTYWMNRLQSLPTASDIFVSLNPATPPAPADRIHRMTYDHPVFDRASVRAQRLLPLLQGRDRLWFCGSYHGYGFHEDALRSAVEVARGLGVRPPWEGIVAPSASSSRRRQVAADLEAVT